MTERPVEILLVEDNPFDLELTMHALQEYHIVNHVKAVRDGAEALEFLFGADTRGGTDLEHSPKLILLDLKLPKVDGLEVLRRLKAEPRSRKIPVVILTSSKEDCDVAEAYSLGVNSYIVKPVDFEQFNQAVRQVGLYWMLLNEPSVRT